jgi:hypothetical protein
MSRPKALLVVPVMPAEHGNGLAMRAGLLLEGARSPLVGRDRALVERHRTVAGVAAEFERLALDIVGSARAARR